MSAKKYVLDRTVVTRQLEGDKRRLDMDIKGLPKRLALKDHLNVISFSTSAASHYQRIACFEYLLEPDVNRFYERLRTAVSYGHRAIEAVELLPEANWNYYIHSSTAQAEGILALSSCILATEFATARFCANVNRPFVQSQIKSKKELILSPFVHYDFYDSFLTNKDSLQDLNDRVRQSIAKSVKDKDSKYAVVRLSVLLPLIERNTSDFHEKIYNLLDLYYGYLKRYPEPEICRNALMYCHMAMVLGMEVSVDHQFLPKELILPAEYVREQYNKTDLVPAAEIGEVTE